MKRDIYIIKNTINDMCYVGQSVDYKTRFRKHKEEAKRNNYQYKSSLYDAMNEYGIENFWVEPLEFQVENCDERETYWINKLNTLYPNGYNLVAGGCRYPNLCGILHHDAKIKSEDELLKIYDELINGNKSMTEIGRKFGVKHNVIDGINRGETYRIEGYEFPLRQFTLTQGQLDRLTFDLKYSTYTYLELAELYGVSINQVKSINYGNSWHRKYLKYPLRHIYLGSKSGTDIIANIQKDLISTNISFSDLAKKYNCAKTTVIRINLGQSHKKESLQYPLRRSQTHLTQQIINEIHNKLLYTDESINSIAEFAHVSTATIKRINNGVTRRYKDNRLSYPLRPL